MMYVRVVSNIVLLSLSLFLTACAVRIAPSGGPQDKTPPSVDTTSPPQRTRNFTGGDITIRFSTYVQPTVRNAISVQPTATFNSSYSGDEVDVTFTEPLAPNTTYTVTIGSDYTDTRGNKPAEAYSLVFSTGSSIDTGTVSGSVTATSMDNITIFCYQGADTLTSAFTPRNRQPKYRLPVGTSGAFTVNGLADGTYRVMAVRDVNRNGLLDPNEEFGMARADVTVRDGRSTPVALRMGPPIDVLRPYITRVRALSSRRLLVQFSEPVVPAQDAMSIGVTDTLDHTTPVMAMVQAPGAKDRFVVLTTESMIPGNHKVRFDTTTVRDTTGNALSDTTLSHDVNVPALDDTTSLRLIAVSVRDSARNITSSTPFEIEFSDFVNRTTVSVRGTVTGGTDTVPLSAEWKNDRTLVLKMGQSLKASSQYDARISLSELQSLTGVGMPDTTIVRTFRTSDRTDPGTVNGTFRDTSLVGGPYLLRFIDDRGAVVRTLEVRSGETWVADSLPAGTYSLDVIIDTNRNGRFDHGTSDPYTPSERWIRLPATVLVRQRWTLDGIHLVI